MIENVLHDLGGVGIFGIVSICLFFTFFSGMLLWAARLKKPYLNSMRNLPLDGGESAPRASSEKTSNLETRHE
jgi:hypothetical protein